MKINNFDEEYLEELEIENYKSKYKKREKKNSESFNFEELLSEHQRKIILGYISK